MAMVNELVKGKRYAFQYCRNGRISTVMGRYLHRVGDNIWIQTLLRDYPVTVGEFQKASSASESESSEHPPSVAQAPRVSQVRGRSSLEV
jgi:hypothetical protein